LRPRRICDIYDLFALHINVLTYLLTYFTITTISTTNKNAHLHNNPKKIKIFIKYRAIPNVRSCLSNLINAVQCIQLLVAILTGFQDLQKLLQLAALLTNQPNTQQTADSFQLVPPNFEL